MRESLGPALLLILNVATCAPVIPHPAPPVEAPPARVIAVPVKHEVAHDAYADAWALWTAGRHAEAIGMFAPLVQGHGANGVGYASNVATNGTRSVWASGQGTYWFDNAGQPIRYDASDATTASFIPGSPLVVIGGSTLTVVDSTTLEPVLRAPHVNSLGIIASAKTVVYEEERASSSVLHLWDVATRSERQVITLREGEHGSTTLWLSPDDAELGCRYYQDFVTRVALFDRKGARLDFTDDSLPPAFPTYSDDNKWIAYGETGNYQTRGTISLIDRATRAVKTTKVITFPTAMAFSKDGTRLIVGELRQLSILEVPSLRVLARTPVLRELGPIPGDDMQDIGQIEILGNDRAFWARTADGTNGVFRLRSGAPIWIGRGARTIDARGVQQFNGTGENDEMVTIDAAFHVSPHALTQTEREPVADLDAAIRAVLATTVCSVDNRVFPIAACH